MIDNRLIAKLQIAPTFGADNPQTHRVVQSKRTSDGKDMFADFQRSAVAQSACGKIASAHIDHRQIRGRILGDLDDLQRDPVVGFDSDVGDLCRLDDMPIGQHIVASLNIDDHAGSSLLDPLGANLRFLKSRVQTDLLNRLLLGRFDVDHRR